jgi:hypothetical protein
MSIQICVLTDSLIAGIAEWQRVIDSEDFPLRISDDDPNRNLAARLHGEEAEISYDAHDFSELKDTYKAKNFGRDWKYAVAFTWSSDVADAIASWMAATAYARATDGIVFDEQEGKLLTPEESLRVVRELERDRPEMEAALRSFVQQLSPKSPEAAAAVTAFMQRRSSKSDQAR